ncbi:heat-inducible transcriptional repressor HrcA [Synergistaceae bacterium OttesenSCG-928-D05]|nr:heat-inducible transcriptional repressor HrcA [Synergistaceae bacterium OttesenSCG-928-D05]
MLTERQLEIVLSVVYEYIKSGESVGSRTISRRYLTGHSSATIRNEMSDLEEMGYLKQTHTSSGRVPTTMGFRLYVDSVLQRLAAKNSSKDWTMTLGEHRQGLEGALAQASEMLSRMSNYVGIAAISPLDSVKFQRVDFVRVGEKNVLMLVILQGGLVHHKIISIPWDMSQDYLDDLGRRINLFAGRTWTDLKETLQRYILQELREYRDACASALRELEGIMVSPVMKVFTGSMSHMLNLPDFQDLGRIQTLYSFLEQEQGMADMLQKCTLNGGIKVVIGEENESPAMKKSSLVAASTVANGQRAMIGVIGPERMDYERVIAAIEKVLQTMDESPEEEGIENER